MTYHESVLILIILEYIYIRKGYVYLKDDNVLILIILEYIYITKETLSMEVIMS